MWARAAVLGLSCCWLFALEEASDGNFSCMSQPIPVVAGVFGRHGNTETRGVAASTLLYYPRGVALDPAAGGLYLADSANHVVRRVDLATGAVPTVAGTLSSCGSRGDAGPAAEAQLCRPLGVALDSVANQLYIADYGNHAVRRVDLASGLILGVAGVAGTQGQQGDGGLATSALLSFPTGVAVDPAAQKLYVADSKNHAVRVVDLNSTVITTIAGVLGERGVLGDGGPAAAAQLDTPQGLALDTSGNCLFVADSGNFAVRRVDLATGHISTIAGALGAYGAAGVGLQDEGPATSARLCHPSDVALDTRERHLYVADSCTPAVRRVNLATGQILTAIGRTGHYGDGVGASGDVYLALDPAARKLYMAEAQNHAIRSVDLAVLDNGAAQQCVGGRLHTGF